MLTNSLNNTLAIHNNPLRTGNHSRISHSRLAFLVYCTEEVGKGTILVYVGLATSQLEGQKALLVAQLAETICTHLWGMNAPTKVLDSLADQLESVLMDTNVGLEKKIILLEIEVGGNGL